MSQTNMLPSIHHQSPDDRSNSSTTISSSSSSVNGDSNTAPGLQRPKMTSRKSSGTIIVPREHPRVELQKGDEIFDEDDARAMSPRRSSQDLEKMSQDARAQLNEYVFLYSLTESSRINMYLLDMPRFFKNPSSISSIALKP
jgi:hypothetical protein